ncbi:MAG: hypothetical protein A2W01_03785 [Candidatus Solincola sediminis]|uniref:DNA-binding protein n=1 Tax=Candidatus Solincola sediminis TaxID=1797199 RepID=A0A1F2WQ34_9ACTN|nr:MAG: hypothetical protein A2W01_03785 [Candidatus Solincola sediminis]OFW58953.1 MAG: hypothetical protein A2Y75_00225 [Candidatus Solincola sediminis]
MSRRVASIVLVLAGLAAAFLMMSGSALAAHEVSVEELVANMEQYDGQEVVITGEAVGDLLVQGDYGWVTVNDDAYSVKSLEEGGDFAGYSNWGIGVWAPAGELRQIHILGGYKNKGDTVRVTGIFNRADPEHEGDTDIRATSIELLEAGHPIPHPFQYGKLLIVVILLALVAILWVDRRSRIRRARRKQ